MKKIKLIIASLIGTIALSFACVFSTISVNAANFSDFSNYGDYTKNDELTSQVWSFTSNMPDDGNKTLADDAVGKGGLIVKTSNSSKVSKNGTNGLQLTSNSVIYVPVLNNSAGTINFKTTSASNSKYVLLNGNSSYKAVASTTAQSISYSSVDITVVSDKSYLIFSGIVGNFNLGEITVTSTSNPVTSLQQEGKVGTSTLVRFVYIISGNTTLTKDNLTNKLTLKLDGDTENEKTLTRSPNVVSKITSSSDTYSAAVKSRTAYAFDNETNTRDIYVIYIVEFTTSKYIGHTISASLEYNSTSYSTTSYTFA